MIGSYYVHIYFWYSRIQSTNFKLICSSWLEFEPFVVKLVVHNLGRRFNLRQTITLNPRLWLCTDLNLHYPRSLLFNPWLSAFSFLDTIAVSEDRSTFKIRYLFCFKGRIEPLPDESNLYLQKSDTYIQYLNFEQNTKYIKALRYAASRSGADLTDTQFWIGFK